MGSGRIVAWGAVVALILAGSLTSGLAGGVLGQAIGLGAISIGVVAAVSMVFYEVGLTEDRAREADRHRSDDPPPPLTRRLRPPRRRRR